MAKTSKVLVNLINTLNQNSASTASNIQSISEQVSSLKDLMIEDRNLYTKQIRKEFKLREYSSKIRTINTAFQDELDEIKTKRRNIESEIKSILKEERKTEQEKATYYNRTANAEFQSGNLISGLLLKFLGRNEPKKETLDKEERNKKLQDLEQEKTINQQERKSLRTEIKTTLIDNLSPITKIFNDRIEEERNLALDNQYESKIKRESPIIIGKILEPVTIKLSEIDGSVLSNLKKMLESIEFKTSGDTNGVSLPNLPLPIPTGSSKTISKLGRVGRVLGKAAIPLAIASIAYNAYSGITDKGVNETLPSRVGNNRSISFKDRMKSMSSNVLSGVTFGIIEPKTIASALETPLGNMMYEFSNIINPLTAIPTILSKIMDSWPFGSGTPEIQSGESTNNITPSSNLNSFTKPISELEKGMDPDLIQAINKQFTNPTEAETVKRIAHSESGGQNMPMTKSGDEGYFQFNRPSGTSATYLKMIGKSPETSVTSLNAEEQTRMYAEFLNPLRNANVPITPENLKIYGFASGTGLKALKQEQSTGEQSSVIYTKQWVEDRKNDDKKLIDSGKTPIYGHFLKMAELSKAGGNITLKGMRDWLTQGKSTKISADNMQPERMNQLQRMIYAGNITGQVGMLRYKDLSTYNAAPELIKQEIDTEISKETTPQLINGKPIDRATRFNYRKILEQETGLSSSTPGLSYQDIDNLIKLKKGNLSPTQTSSSVNKTGQLTYVKAAENAAFKEEVITGRSSTVIANTFNTSNQQIAQQKQVREKPWDTSNTYQKTYNPLVWNT
jgi:hypothetical protein